MDLSAAVDVTVADRQANNAALDAANYPAALRANKAFHFLLYEGAHMPRLMLLIESLWVRIGPSLNDLYPEFATSRVGVSAWLSVGWAYVAGALEALEDSAVLLTVAKVL